MMFRGCVTDVFTPTKEWVLTIQLAEGKPTAGDRIACGGRTGRVLHLDDPGVRTRACLTGQPILPQLGVLVAWDGEGELPRRGPIASLPKEAPCSGAS